MSVIADSKPSSLSDSAWEGFTAGHWQDHIDVRNFIQANLQPFAEVPDFLETASERTEQLWAQVKALMWQEAERKGPLSIDASKAAGINAHAAGYIDREKELIVGLQTDKPLERAIMPYGGIRLVENACRIYQTELDEGVRETFTRHRKTHNDGVFDVYNHDMLKCRQAGIITGLPDAYGRGRIIGDYRRVALYGVDRLIEAKEAEKSELDHLDMNESNIRLREELSEQIRSLQELIELGRSYDCDLSRPARTAREAVQWTYLGYLAAIKSQNGAAMSLGRVSTFLDIYIQRDIKDGSISEAHAQELVDDLIIKLRMVRFLRTPEYDQLFSGDPTWVTECIGGMSEDGRPLVSKTSYRFLQTLYNLGPAPEPNLTVLWSKDLPEAFKSFCARVSIDTSSIQYENDDLMRPRFGDDYGIACCVSAMRLGKQMQFFGARANLAKTLLYAINGGRDEISGLQVGPESAPLDDEILDYDKVRERFDFYVDWLSRTYMNALNVIHYMHDKYAYEAIEMALHDRDIVRTMACGIAGLSIVADALSAIRWARVRPIRDERGIAVDFEVEGDYPKFGNNDEHADALAAEVVTNFMNHLRKHPTYRNAIPTQSVLTITSNVVYGNKTGTTPDGRKAGEPFAPGANPLHGRDSKGALASMLSVARLPYNDAEDGISYTMSLVPDSLGKRPEERIKNLSGLLDGYFEATGHHVNINVLNRDTLMDAMEHPELYPQLTIRVSGYAVNFIKLTREQQMDVISRTFHEHM